MSENCQNWGVKGDHPRMLPHPLLGERKVTFTNSTEAFLKGFSRAKKTEIEGSAQEAPQGTAAGIPLIRVPSHPVHCKSSIMFGTGVNPADSYNGRPASLAKRYRRRIPRSLQNRAASFVILRA